MQKTRGVIGRVGVNTVSREAVAAATNRLTFGWYKDFTPFGGPLPGPEGEIEYVPILLYQGKLDVPDKRAAAAELYSRLCPQYSAADFIDCFSLSRLTARLSRDACRYPIGSLFLVGVEPGYAENNDDRSPTEIVEDSKVLRETLDGLDCGYRLALGGISTPRCDWNLHAYRGRYGCDLWREVLDITPPDLFDAFVIHPYPTAPQSPDVADLKTQVYEARALMAEFGLQQKDLLVGETGTPFPGIPLDLRRTYVAGAVRFYLTARDSRIGNPHDDDRLIQRFCWFLLSQPEWEIPGFTDNPGLDFSASSLTSSRGELTDIGEVFQQAVHAVCAETE